MVDKRRGQTKLKNFRSNLKISSQISLLLGSFAGQILKLFRALYKCDMFCGVMYSCESVYWWCFSEYIPYTGQANEFFWPRWETNPRPLVCQSKSCFEFCVNLTGVWTIGPRCTDIFPWKPWSTGTLYLGTDFAQKYRKFLSSDCAPKKKIIKFFVRLHGEKI